MTNKGRPAGQTPPKQKISLRVDQALMDQARIAVWYDRTTVTDVLVEALEAFVAAAQKKHNGGAPFTEKK